MLYQFHSDNFIQTLPVQIRMFGVNHLQESIYRPHGVSYFQWFYCVSGQGELILNNQRNIIKTGQGFLIYPDQGHIYQAMSKYWTLHIVAFNGPLCHNLLHLLQMDTSGAYHFSNSTIFENHIQKLLRIHERPSSCQSISYSKECYDFLLDLSGCIIHTSPLSYSTENPFVLKIISWLEENYAQPINLNELSEIVHLTKDYMCTLFKKNTGQTIIQCLINIRLGHARQFLMQYPEIKIIDIAHMCGFDSPSYFGKIFKKNIGMTPEQYRKNS